MDEEEFALYARVGGDDGCRSRDELVAVLRGAADYIERSDYDNGQLYLRDNVIGYWEFNGD